MQENTDNITDKGLWNQERFHDTYDRYFRVMVNYACQFVNSLETAEDIVQEVFVKFWVKKDTMHGDDAFVRLLHISVRNRCLDHLKHQAVEHSYVSRAALETSENLEDSIFAAEIYSRLWKAIDQLPKRQRQTLKLVCEGKTNAEIATEMSVGIETVKNQKYKAISSLRKIFDNETLVLMIPALFMEA